jgi:hypothetical protein
MLTSSVTTSFYRSVVLRDVNKSHRNILMSYTVAVVVMNDSGQTTYLTLLFALTSTVTPTPLMGVSTTVCGAFVKVPNLMATQE